MMILEVGMSQKLSNVMESSPVSIKENVSSVKLHEEKSDVCASKCEEKNSEENLMITCASNYEDNSFHMEVDRDQDMTMGPNEDVEVDVVGNGIVVEEMMADRESQSLDATENSSSFGCTDSGIGAAGVASDVEVESQLRDGDGSLKELDRLDLFKTRKKVTSHWRKFIQSVMWRCKWAELQMRKLDYLESKYDRELAECGRRKKRELENCAAEDLAIKSTPFVCQNRSRRVFKRKKRKRVEEMTDVAAYSSSHSLFSYFASKKNSGGSAYLDDNPSNTVTTSGEFDDIGEWVFLEFKDSNAFEKILRYIEVTQIRVRELKARIDEVITENAERFTSANSKSGLRGPLSSSGPSSILPKVNSENLVSPKCVVSGRGEVNSLPHMIGTAEQLRIGEKGLEIKSEILLSNQSVKEESNTLEHQSVTEVKVEDVQHLAVPNSPSKSPAPGEQSAVKVRPKSMSTPKNKRQRMRRKARPGGRWVRKSCG